MNTTSTLFHASACPITFASEGDGIRVTSNGVSTVLPVHAARQVWNGLRKSYGYSTTQQVADPQPVTEWDQPMDEADDFGG